MKPFLNKGQLIEKIVSQVDDYDLETLVEACKDLMRANLSKLPIKELKPMADALDEVV